MSEKDEILNEMITELSKVAASYREMPETVRRVMPWDTGPALRKASVEITRVTAEECAKRLDEVIEQLRLKTIPTPAFDPDKKLPAEAVLVSQHLKDVLVFTEKRIEGLAGRRVGICLVVFTDGRFQYISNCDRAQVAGPLQKLLDNWKAGLPDIKAHETH